MLRLVLVRHGQTDANLNRVLQGQSDGELNATGSRQAEELGRHLKDFRIDQIIASPMRRAQDTAAAIARHHQLAVKTNPLVVEWNCGVLDGVPAEIFRKKLQESNGEVKYGELAKYIKDNVSLESVLVNDKEQTPQVNVSSSIQSEWVNYNLK